MMRIDTHHSVKGAQVVPTQNHQSQVSRYALIEVRQLTGHPEPDPTKVRTWTDRSGSFRVEAQFIGLTDGKIHLHKQNGIKIAVPTSKMAVEDLEYVEKVTGVSLDDDKPLENIRRKLPRENEQPRPVKGGASIEPP